MTRKPKIHFSKAFYHVMLRGNYKQNVFLCPDDYHYFYKLLEKVTKNYGCKIHLFCLMSNHIHLVIEVDYAPLGKIIQSIASPYARYFNKNIQLEGHLFQGRYLSKLVHDEKYLLELCYYIHMNPLKAFITKNLDDYPWSSHLVYRKIQKIDWVTTCYVELLLKKQMSAEDFYMRFMNNRNEFYTEPTYCVIDQDGNLTITDSVNIKLNKFDQLNITRYTLSEIMAVICKTISISKEDLISDCRSEKLVLARSMVVYFAHYYAKYRLNYIALYLGREPAGLSKNLHSLIANKNGKAKQSKAECWMKIIRHAFEEDMQKLG